ncbi:unnamed protein product [Merluccius merluccius]
MITPLHFVHFFEGSKHCQQSSVETLYRDTTRMPRNDFNSDILFGRGHEDVKGICADENWNIYTRSGIGDN